MSVNVISSPLLARREYGCFLADLLRLGVELEVLLLTTAGMATVWVIEILNR